MYEKKDRRTVCRMLSSMRDGMLLECCCNSLADCPKSRSRCIITSACWRVHNKDVKDASGGYKIERVGKDYTLTWHGERKV